jgi:hypothetical protein
MGVGIRSDLDLTSVSNLISGDRFRWGGQWHAVAGFRQIHGSRFVALETFEGRTFRANPDFLIYAECVPREDEWDK